MVHQHGGERAARKGAGGDRRNTLGPAAGAQPDRGDGRRQARLVRLAPARLGCADRGLHPSRHRPAIARWGGDRARRRRGRAPWLGHLVQRRCAGVPGQRLRPGGMGKGHRHHRSVVRFGLDPRLCPRAAAGAPVAGLALSRRLGPASRLVQFFADRSLRHPRPGPVRRGADPWLRARRRGPQDVEIARQRGRAPGRHEAERRRHPAAVGGGLGLFRRSAHRPGDPQASERYLSPAAQHPALSSGRARRLRAGRAGQRRGGWRRGDAGARAVGAAPPGGARRGGAALGRGVRFSRHVYGTLFVLRARSFGILLRCAQGPALLRRARATSAGGRCAPCSI